MSTPDFNEVMLPAEAARFLGITTQRLSRLRRAGKVRATPVEGTNLHTFALADLRNVDLNYEKRGPKEKQRISRGDPDWS